MRIAVRQVRPPGRDGKEHLVRRKIDTDELRPNSLCGRSVDPNWFRHIVGWIDLSKAIRRAGPGSCSACQVIGRALVAEATLLDGMPERPRPTTVIGRLRAMVERYRAVVAGDRPEAEDWARQLDREAATVLAETTQERESRLEQIAEIVKDVYERATGPDGEVRSTIEVIDGEEISEIYRLATGKSPTVKNPRRRRR